MNAAGQHFRGQLSASFSKVQDIPVDVDAEEYGYQSDSDLEDDWDLDDLRSPTSSSSGGKKGKGKADDADDIDEPNVKPVVSKSTIGVEHTVLVTDVAANTWEALLFYIYTGKVQFASLRSEGAEERMCAMKQHKHDHPHRPPLCSPKSIYRLADKIGLDGLKAQALVELKKRLDSKMILDEIFSRFSSWYPDILKAQVDFFCDHALSDPRVMLGLQQKIRGIVKGDVQHGDNVLMSLLQRLPVSRPPDIEKPLTSWGCVPEICEFSIDGERASTPANEEWGGKKEAAD
ncbi:hypothetical protein QCA50_014523 [Cerrena zonata]|uniref:BTB domain-containing protein n=1 Tax=Cerrena zonata TaxID=2478898 RepID=A0AAW0FRY3_9APHY